LLALTLCLVTLSATSLRASDSLEFAGDIGRILLPISAWTTAFLKKDYSGMVQFSQSMVAAVGITYALKYSLHTRRPNGKTHAFPSGHTSVAFCAASFGQKRYGLSYGLPAFITAAFVGYTRLASKNHYGKDVLAGAAIGIITGYLFTDRYPQVDIQALVGPDLYGLIIGKAF